jgi:hypothetical protein
MTNGVFPVRSELAGVKTILAREASGIVPK